MKGFAWFADLAAAPTKHHARAPLRGIVVPRTGGRRSTYWDCAHYVWTRAPMRYSTLDVVLKRLLSGYSSRPILHVPVSLPCVGF
jgi:hypothetical protein